MKNKILFSLAMLFLSGIGVSAQNLIEGYKRVYYPDDLKEGKAYFIISDRTKFAGNNSGKPKGMSIQLDSYKIKWGDQYVYWGDFDADEEGFQWIAEKVEGDQWAFKNKVKGQYLGRESGSDNDVLFSSTPVGYTLTDLEEGEGRFYMISSEDKRSPHVQGFVRSDRPNNCLAKQDVGVTSYVDDVATNGYPARWQIYEVESAGEEPQSEFFSVSNGYYYILNALDGDTNKMCWTERKADAPAYELGASLTLSQKNDGDPRSIYYIEAVDKEKGQYRVSNYVTGKYVSDTMKNGLVFMTDEAKEPLTFRTMDGYRKAFCIYNADGEMFATIKTEGVFHVGGTFLCYLEPWKLQKVDAASLESPAAQLKLALAKKMDEVGHPDFIDHSGLSEEQLTAFRNLWDKANKDLCEGTFDILYESDINNLDAAAKGTYAEPIYNRYQKKNLRVLSYNVKHCAGNKDGLNLPRTAKVISAQHADVVALQEVDSVFSSRSDYKYQIKELAEATGMYGIFCSALTGYGIGILSTQLPLSVKAVALTSDFEPRRMLVAEFDNYVFASLHVGLSASARRGSGPIIKAEAERWVEKGKPLIIAGDFNDDGTDGEMEGARGVLTKYLQTNGFTFHSDLKTPTWSDGIYVIDNIISYDKIGGVEKVCYKVVNDKVTSDHMPILGDLIIGFEDPDAIGAIPDKGTTPIKSGIYSINGTLVSDSAEAITTLPNGIYIFDGKKIKK